MQIAQLNFADWTNILPHTRNQCASLSVALGAAQKIATDGRIIESRKLSRNFREKLLVSGNLNYIAKGYYLLVYPGEKRDMVWQDSFLRFARLYLHKKFGSNYWLSPLSTLQVLRGNNLGQLNLCVSSPKGSSSRTLMFPMGGSVTVLKGSKPGKTQWLQGLRCLSVSQAIINLERREFTSHEQICEFAFKNLTDTSEIRNHFETQFSLTQISRIIGALIHCNRNHLAKELIAFAQDQGIKIRGQNPFLSKLCLTSNLKA
jgi:hypothetical protein